MDPWAVVVRYGRWYLLCHSHRADAIRTCRVDRVRAVPRTAHEFEPPNGLDPVAALEENLGTGWEFPTRVVFDAPMAEVAPWIRPPMGRLEPSGDGCVLVASTSSPAMYAPEWLASVPFAFRVGGGPELRAAVATSLRVSLPPWRTSPDSPVEGRGRVTAQRTKRDSDRPTPPTAVASPALYGARCLDVSRLSPPSQPCSGVPEKGAGRAPTPQRCAPQRRTARSVSARVTARTSSRSTCSRGAWASLTSPGP